MGERMSDERLAEIERELFPPKIGYNPANAEAAQALQMAAHSTLEYELFDKLKAERQEAERLRKVCYAIQCVKDSYSGCTLPECPEEMADELIAILNETEQPK